MISRDREELRGDAGHEVAVRLTDAAPVVVGAGVPHGLVAGDGDQVLGHGGAFLVLELSVTSMTRPRPDPSTEISDRSNPRGRIGVRLHDARKQ